MGRSVRYLTTLLSISIALIILTINFNLVWGKLPERSMFSQFMTYSMLILFIIASGFFFVALETFDTGSNPWKENHIRTVEYLRIAGMRMYVIGFLSLMLGVLCGVSIVWSSATFVGAYVYSTLLYHYLLIYK